jgi:uncharacterized protein YjiS (DUF1127 family)
MSHRQTSHTSEPGRDNAGLNVTVVKDASGMALTEACPNASIAAPRHASSEKQAAGPPVASTRSVWGLLREYWRAFRKRRQRKRSCVSVHELSDRALKDIGLIPGHIDYLAARRTIERLGDDTMYLWRS